MSEQRLYAVVMTGWLLGGGGGTMLVSTCLALVGLRFSLLQTLFFAGWSALVGLVLSLPIALLGMLLVRVASNHVMRHPAAFCIVVPILCVAVAGLFSLLADGGHSVPILAYVGVDSVIAAWWCWWRASRSPASPNRRLAKVFD